MARLPLNNVGTTIRGPLVAAEPSSTLVWVRPRRVNRVSRESVRCVRKQSRVVQDFLHNLFEHLLYANFRLCARMWVSERTSRT